MMIKRVFTAILFLSIFNACNMSHNNSNKELGSEPPQPVLLSKGIEIKTYQSSYCWKTKCVDYISPDEMLKEKEKNKVTANSTITINFEGNQPTELFLTIYNQGTITQEKINDNKFNAPVSTGVFYFLLSANWLKDKEKRIAEGDSSYAFALEVEQ